MSDQRNPDMMLLFNVVKWIDVISKADNYDINKMFIYFIQITYMCDERGFFFIKLCLKHTDCSITATKYIHNDKDDSYIFWL